MAEAEYFIDSVLEDEELHAEITAKLKQVVLSIRERKLGALEDGASGKPLVDALRKTMKNVQLSFANRVKGSSKYLLILLSRRLHALHRLPG